MVSFFRFLLASLVLFSLSSNAQACAFCDNDIYRVVGVAYNDVLNIRERATSRSAIVGVIPPDSDDVIHTGGVQYTGRTEWFQIFYNGDMGWVSSKFLEFTGRRVGEPDEAYKDTEANPDLPPHADWYRVDVAFNDPLNVRTGPGVGNQIVAALPDGTVVADAERSAQIGNSTWIMIHYAGRVGWVNKNYLQPY